MTIVPAYSALFALFFIVLSARTILARRSAQIAIGTGGDKMLERTARVHANFSEYVPFTCFALRYYWGACFMHGVFPKSMKISNFVLPE